MDGTVSDSLFLGDLSIMCTEVALVDLFSRYGEVCEVRIKKSMKSKLSLGYGFVRMASEEQAINAMMCLQGSLFLGRYLKIGWSRPVRTNKLEKLPSESNSAHVNSIHVQFKTLKPNVPVNDEILLNIFLPLGNIVDVSIKSINLDENTGHISGFAFVQFPNTPEGLESACACAVKMKRVVIRNILLKCELSKNLIKVLGENPKCAPSDFEEGSSHPRIVSSTYPTAGPSSSSSSIDSMSSGSNVLIFQTPGSHHAQSQASSLSSGGMNSPMMTPMIYGNVNMNGGISYLNGYPVNPYMYNSPNMPYMGQYDSLTPSHPSQIALGSGNRCYVPMMNVNMMPSTLQVTPNTNHVKLRHN